MNRFVLQVRYKIGAFLTFQRFILLERSYERLYLSLVGESVCVTRDGIIYLHSKHVYVMAVLSIARAM